MTILTKQDIEKINRIVVYLMKEQIKPVKEIKLMFDLTDEEYEMCMDLAMPHIRIANEALYYKRRFSALLNDIGFAVKRASDDRKFPLKDGLYDE